jgi:hypothetical protein
MFKILVKDVESWMQSERALFAGGEGKRFYVTVHAGPGVKRYIVQNMRTGKEDGFTNRGEAVRFFNQLRVEQPGDGGGPTPRASSAP